MPDGYQVDLTVLDEASQAVAQTFHDMKTYKIDNLVGEESQYGHAAVHAAFDDFCDRWQTAVELLLEDNDKMVTALNASMDAYGDTEDAITNSAQVIGGGADPALEAADG